MQHPGHEVPSLTASLKKLVADSSADAGTAAEKVRRTGDVEVMAESRNKQLAIMFTAATQLALVIADYGKPKGPDHRAGLAFIKPAVRPG